VIPDFQGENDLSTAVSLVALGPAAIPDLTAALDPIERKGQLAPGAEWLLWAYAVLQGRAAFPELRRMLDDDRLGPLKFALDYAAAISLGLTSYVSNYGKAFGGGCCLIGRPWEPRDALEGLVRAWWTGDQASMDSTLTEAARAALARPVPGRGGVPAPVPDRMASVGFRFETPARWSLPEVTLDQGLQDLRGTGHVEQFPETNNLETRFTDRLGQDCGRRVIRFKTQTITSANIYIWRGYVLDDPDMHGLVDLIAACAARR